MLDWYKKEKPFASYTGFGGSSTFKTRRFAQQSSEYFYLPLNETVNNASRSKFGNYASSVTVNAGGRSDSDHPYTITDTTYNGGSAYSHRCSGDTNTAYLSANTKLGSVGTGDLCWDMYYNWVSTGNGGGSYGFVGDYAYSGALYSGSRTGLSQTNYLALGGIASQVGVKYRYGGNYVEWDSSLTTNSNLGVWYHVLVVRQSNKWYSFLNGTLNAYHSESGHNILNGGGFHFGTIDRGGHYWSCRISDFMWQKGNDCFYYVNPDVNASNIGTTYFTPPRYKNKVMAISSNPNFSILKAPPGFTVS